MGLETALPTDSVITTQLNRVINWARRSAIWPMPFATACCGIELMATACSRYDLARFGAARCAGCEGSQRRDSRGNLGASRCDRIPVDSVGDEEQRSGGVHHAGMADFNAVEIARNGFFWRVETGSGRDSGPDTSAIGRDLEGAQKLADRGAAFLFRGRIASDGNRRHPLAIAGR